MHLKAMNKVILVAGILVSLYTLLAMLFGIPEITDLLPVSMFSETQNHYKVVATDKKSLSAWYTLGVGAVLIIIGVVLPCFSKKWGKK
ncbi:hypothetical protein NBRC116493_02690 [Aurantivibrio infirmus]